VLLLLGTETLYAFGASSYINDVIAHSGGRSATAVFEGASVVLTEEFVIRENPDIIVGAFADHGTMEGLTTKYPAWKVVKAVRNGHLCTANPDHLLRPGPRLVSGINTLARCISTTHAQLPGESG
jgi:iron complex transport system substrate-binding protein